MKKQQYSTRVQAPAFNPNLALPTLVRSNINDGLALKPSGRTNLDNRDNVKADPFLKRKKPVILSSFNTNTLRSDCKRAELAHEAQNLGIDIICLQEHRIEHSEPLVQQKFPNGYTMITCSAWKNSINASIGGVGFLISPSALKACIKIHKHSNRIIEITLNGSPATTIFSCYSPHNEYTEEDVTQFYYELSSAVYSVPAHNLVVLGGDFNAQLGPEDARFTISQMTNRNGLLLKDFMEEHNLLATNTRFQHRKGRLWTHKRPNGQLAQIDYILVRKKWINSIKNSRAYRCFEGIGSDHRIVSCKCQISYRKCKNQPKDPMKCIDWRQVNQNNQMKDQYTIAVYNKFCTLCDELDDNSNTSEVYDRLIDANKEIALQTLPKKTKKVSNVSTNENVTRTREILKRESAKHHTRPTRNTKKNLENAKRAHDEAYTKALENEIKAKTEEFENLHTDKKHAAAWHLLKDITDKKSTPVTKIKGDTAEERRENWFKHFKDLLGSPVPASDTEDPFFNQKVCDPLPINTGPFSMGELLFALKKVQLSKSSGPDNIPAVIWKSPLFHETLLKFCNETLFGNKPKAFSLSSIIPIPKKGDLSSPSNYRGITLSPIAAKIYNSMLLNRLIPYVDPILRNNQNGFRKGRSTSSQILTIRRIIEELQISREQGTIIFLDFSKAFDSVNRYNMIKILSNYGIPNEIIQAIDVMYTDSFSFIQSVDGSTEQFATTSGILQGDTLAPYLFIIVVDYILRFTLDPVRTKGIDIKPTSSNREKQKYLTDLDYADDIALTTALLKNAQELLLAVEDASAKFGLQLNSKKTEYMTFNEAHDHAPIKTREGAELKEVTDFKYLGSYVCDSRKDFLTRKALAWSACNKLHLIWESNISLSIKLSLFRACVESILLYGSETWTMKKSLIDRLDGTYTRLLMRVQSISWRDHKTKDEIYGDLSPISTTVIKRKIRFAGHCFRSKNEVISDVLLLRLPRKIRGRRPLNFVDSICRDTNNLLDDLPTLMSDRKAWRSIVNSFSDASD